MSYGDKLKSTLLKPLVKAAVSGVAARMVYGNGQVTVFGNEVSMMTFGAGIGLGSEAIAQIVNMWVLPKLESNNKARHYESLVVSIGVSAGSFALISALVSSNTPTSSELATFAGIGALTEVVSSYVYDNAFSSMGGQVPLFSIA